MNSIYFNSKLYISILGFYVFSLVFLYPFGITIGTTALRISDFITIILIGIASALLIKTKKMYKDMVAIWFILPFLLMEFSFHILGVIQYPHISIMSSVRILFLYVPLLFILIYFNKTDMEKLNITVEKSVKVSLVITFIYSIIQLMVVYGFVPFGLLLSNYLQPFAVDSHFKVIDGTRVSGFFNNGIGLSIFGVVCFSYFFSKIQFRYSPTYIFYIFLSILLIVFSSTRVALLVVILILITNVLFVKSNLIIKFKTVSWFLVSLIIIGLVINVTIGLETILNRVLRLSDGLNNDYSFVYRTEHLWPGVLEMVNDLPFGTLVQPFNIVGLIDSGYISYYAQGKWMFIIAMLLFLVGSIVFSVFTYRTSNEKWSNIFLINISIYMIIEAITHNPMRNPLLLFFLFIAYANIIKFKNYDKANNELTNKNIMQKRNV